MAARPEVGDRVDVPGYKRPFRIVGHALLDGEAAVDIARHGSMQRVRIPVADLVKNEGRRGWHQRWKQQDLFA